MPKFFVNQEQIDKEKINIIGKDVNHIKNVLRKEVGSKITICNTETGQDYLCSIDKLKEEEIICSIIEKLEQNSEANVKVTIMQGLPKADKMELIIQKSVELGVTDIIPIEMKRCIVKLNEKDKTKKVDRWQKISEVASKQCGRNVIPKINLPISLKNICTMIDKYDIVLVCYENEKDVAIKEELKKIKSKEQEEIKIAIIIGPEGGIAEEEIELLKNAGAKTITLGKRILRTETVALNVLSIIMYELER